MKNGFFNITDFCFLTQTWYILVSGVNPVFGQSHSGNSGPADGELRIPSGPEGSNSVRVPSQGYEMGSQSSLLSNEMSTSLQNIFLGLGSIK